MSAGDAPAGDAPAGGAPAGGAAAGHAFGTAAAGPISAPARPASGPKSRRQARKQARKHAKQTKRATRRVAPSRRQARRQAKQAKRDRYPTGRVGAAGIDVGAMPTRAAGTRRRLPGYLKRLLFVAGGVVVAAASVAGFWYSADAFDERAPVLVAARDIAAGDTLSVSDLTSASLVLGTAVPHEPWTDDAPLSYEGMVATQPIPAGGLVRFEMVRAAGSGAEGSELEVVVPLDLSLAAQEVADGDMVLLVDPGQEPAEADDGRPRQVALASTLANFDGGSMRLYVPPEEWAQWEALLEEAGGALMVVPLGDGGDAVELAARLDAVWRAQWADAVDEIAAAEAEEREAFQGGPGELEVIVSFDTSLAPSGLSDGDMVLVVDPGAEPLGNDPGRPRTVIGSLELENWVEGRMRMFVPPEEWLYWRALPDRLGADPMVLGVPAGTDVEDVSTRLNAQWHDAWRASVAGSATGG
ncbi:SAF domain-containing protein [Candidatus Poriferisodalis sp.]|uniref:SAF domain-containing protein n=1 Tax=Candidatus Poriferisodalis sp. TaxID=3101277 RepID=UPI003B027A31